MITGIGVDIVDIGRFRFKDTTRLETTANGFLGEEEKVEFKIASDKASYLAKRFAAKEAFIKATGTTAPMHTIQVLHKPSGAPYIECSYYHAPATQVSLSDEKDYAIAFVVAGL